MNRLVAIVRDVGIDEPSVVLGTLVTVRYPIVGAESGDIDGPPLGREGIFRSLDFLTTVCPIELQRGEFAIEVFDICILCILHWVPSGQNIK